MSALSLIARIAEIFTDAQADEIGKGRVIVADTAEGPKLFKLCKLKAAASDLSAGMIAMIDDPSAHQVVTAATLHQKAFGGARCAMLTGGTAPTTLTAGNWAFLQIAGYAKLVEGDSCNTWLAGELLVPDDDADKGRVGGVLTAPASNSTANIGLYGDSHDSAFAISKAASAAVADTAVLCSIFRNAWGAYAAAS